MNILAFDTVTESLSIAVVSDDHCDRLRLHLGVGHSRMLLSEIDGLLDRNNLSLEKIDLIGVGIGPGAFTGVRIGVAAAQAMAFAVSKPVIGVSSLAAMVQIDNLNGTDSGLDSTKVVAVIDARMGEVYAGFFDISYRESGEAVVRQHGPEQVVAVADLKLPSAEVNEAINIDWHDGGYRLVIATPESTAGNLTDALTIAKPTTTQHDIYPSASIVAQMARARFLSGDVGDPMTLVPSYVRNQVAKTASQR